MKSRQPRRLLTSALLLLIAAAPACVNPPPPKVSVENLQSDILFGVPSQLVAEAPPQAALPFAELAPLDFPSFPSPLPRQTFTLTSEGPCPTAPFTAFPEESASTNVEQPPKEGGYRWQRQGTVTAGGKLIYLTVLERSLVRRVVEALDPNSSVPSATPSKTWTYQTVQPVGDMKLFSNFQVRTNGQASDPERGVVLKGMELFPASGPRAFFFTPTVGLLLLPLPVAPGSTFTSEAIDPGSAQRWSLSGKITGRQRVDACGDLVEGWMVETDLTFSGARSGTAKFEYVVSPQRGGVLVREKSSGEGYLGGPANAEFTLGQLNPDPLTQAEK